MEVEEYIERIVDNGKVEDMHTLSNILEEVMLLLEKYDKEQYEEYEMKLYEMAYGKKLTDEKKIEWVKNMKPTAKWTIQDIEEFYSRYEINMPLYSFFVVINLLYSDMGNVLNSNNSEDALIKYITASQDWYYDEDAKNTEEAKLYNYWKYIVN